MVNENGMVEYWSAGGDLRHAKHLRPELPRFNRSISITPQLQYSNPPHSIGFGRVKCLIDNILNRSLRIVESAKCAMVLPHSAFSPLWKKGGQKQHLFGAESLKTLGFK